jgi:hypothetical protein
MIIYPSKVQCDLQTYGSNNPKLQKKVQCKGCRRNFCNTASSGECLKQNE